MENFISWEVLTTYSSFITIVYMLVEFTKEIKIIKKVPTVYWSFFISFILLVVTNAVMGTFNKIDIVLYLITSVSISLGSNGLSNFNEKRKK